MSAEPVLREDGLFVFPDLPAGFAAGFTTRRLAPDEVGAAETARRLAEALGAGGAERTRLTQVHGRDVVVLDGPPREGEDLVAGRGDALVTGVRGRLLAVASADCVPILLLDRASGRIAAVHAGWRGTAARILDAALDTLRPARTSDVVALFGPSISRDRYEVGPEVVDALRAAYASIDVPPDAIRAGAGDRAFLDVAAFDRALLAARGVESIASGDLCTSGSPELFPSYRRDGVGTGRVMTGIVRL